MSIPATYLTGLYGALAGGGTSLLQTLYGAGGQSANASGLNPIQALRSAEQNQAQGIKVTAAQPEVKRAVAAFTKAVNSATSVQKLLGNPAVMQVLLTANGLADRITAPALARKALMSKLDDPKSLVNQLADTRWKNVVQTYDFANKGLSVIKDPKVIAKLADAYAEVAWRHSLDQSTPGLSNALTFRAQAGKVSSVYQILGDSVLRDVVTTALGIPREIAFQSLTAQETAISTRLDIKKLQDPKFVETFAQRYLVNAGAKAASGTTGDLTSLAVKTSGLVV